MTSYSGMDYDRLVEYIMSGDQGSAESAAAQWKTACDAADDVHATLRPRADEVEPHYRGADGKAFADTLDTLDDFAKQINVDASDAFQGMKNIAAALKTAQQAAEPIIARVEAAKDAKEREKLKKQAELELAGIMETLAKAYQDVAVKLWHDPAPAPEELPDGETDTAAVWVPEADDEFTDPTGDPETGEPSQWDPHVPVGEHGQPADLPTDPGMSDYEGGGLAGSGSSVAAAPPGVLAGPVGGYGGAGTGAAGSAIPMGGLAAAGAGGGAGAGQPAAAKPGGSARGGMAGAGMLGSRGHSTADDDGTGDHTWLTEDEITWTADSSAPVVIGGQERTR